MQRRLLGAALLAISMAAVGCKGDNTDVSLPSASDLAAGTLGTYQVVITGRVVEKDGTPVAQVSQTGPTSGSGSSFQDGIPGAAVSVELHGQLLTAITLGPDGSFPSGRFALSLSPTESRVLRVRVSHPLFAPRDFLVFVPARARSANAQLNQVHEVDMGRLKLDRGSDQSVVVRLDNDEPHVALKLMAIQTDVSDRTESFRMDPSDFRNFSKFVVENYVTDTRNEHGDNLTNLIHRIFETQSQSSNEDDFEPFTVTEQVVFTDAAGRATFHNLAQSSPHFIVVPSADLFGQNGPGTAPDGRPDFNAKATDSFTPATAPQPLAIDLHTHDLTVAPSRVGDSRISIPSFDVFTGPLVDTDTSFPAWDEEMDTSHALTGRSMTVVFRFPVDIVGGTTGFTGGALASPNSPRFTLFKDNLKNPLTDATFSPGHNFTTSPDPSGASAGFLEAEKFIGADAVPATLSTGEVVKNIWIFTARSALPDNEFLALQFSARDPNDSDENASHTSSNSDSDLSLDFYVPRVTGGLTTAFVPTADNYNGTTASPSAVNKGSVCLEFPELVTGYYQVLQLTNGTTTADTVNIRNPELFTLGSPSEGNGLTFTDGRVDNYSTGARVAGSTNPGFIDTGKDAGVFYRVFLRCPIEVQADTTRFSDSSTSETPFLSMPDDASANTAGQKPTRSVRVHISAESMTGVRLEGTFDLKIQ